LLEIIKKHKRFLEDSGIISNYMKNRIKSETIQILKHKLTKKAEELINSDEKIEAFLEKAIKKSLDPYSLAGEILKLFFEK
jgi:LAO/AO transport system kinase